MNIKASGRSALIIAAGILIGFAGPLRANENADDALTVSREASQPESAGAPIALKKFTKHSSRHTKKVAHRKSSKVAAKVPQIKVAAAEPEADDGGSETALPPAVANANAQLAAADIKGDNARAMTARANSILQASPARQDDAAEAQAPANGDVVASDQLNDLDRALSESPTPAAAPPVVIAAVADAPAPASPPPVVASSSNDDSTWGQTSLIGKIFIAFGGLLTLASAARMFMA